MDTTLTQVLEATGYLINGKPAAPSVVIPSSTSDRSNPDSLLKLPSFKPDAIWQSQKTVDATSNRTGLRSFFKFVKNPDLAEIAGWQREIWNCGFAPLLWLVFPDRIDLYNGFSVPKSAVDVNRHQLKSYPIEAAKLAELDQCAGRLTMETDGVWEQFPDINRKDSVDQHLLNQLSSLEQRLAEGGLSHQEAQSLIGRSIFTQYLVDGGAIPVSELKTIANHTELSDVFKDRDATTDLFRWLRDTFNGDMFTSSHVPATMHLEEIGEFLSGTDPKTGQRSLFPYRFDVIPPTLISAIYEQFLHAAKDSTKTSNKVEEDGVYYTPHPAVSFVLDEVLEGCTGTESVLDTTCGSGIFLVEALRRLVLRRTNGKPTREAIRTTLYEQVHGVDISEEAIQIAAFSLYLAALELDPTPSSRQGIKFEPLVNKTLHVGNSFEVDLGDRKFDAIVGNPPWNHSGSARKKSEKKRSSDRPMPSRSEGMKYAMHAMKFAKHGAKLGMFLSATPFFSKTTNSQGAIKSLISKLDNPRLVNFSEWSSWFFAKASMPAMCVLGDVNHDQNDSSAMDELVLAHARWSPVGSRSQWVDFSPNDITQLPVASWHRNKEMLKAAFLGLRHDRLLLESFADRFSCLETALNEMGTSLHSGVTLGSQEKRNRDASFLHRLPYIQSKDLGHFTLPTRPKKFKEAMAQWPRSSGDFAAPLIIIRQSLRLPYPRMATTFVNSDTSYSDSYYGISPLPSEALGYLLAGILSSSVASWYMLMAGSNFGIWKRKIAKIDLEHFRIPDLRAVKSTKHGEVIVDMVREFHQKPPKSADWHRLDEAVYDLYGLNDIERTVVNDGLFRASCQWSYGRKQAFAYVSYGALHNYAETFITSMNAWLSRSERHCMKAEIIDLPRHTPWRIVHFSLIEESEQQPEIKTVTQNCSLHELLAEMGDRAKTQIQSDLVGYQDLRVHAHNSVYLIKPAAHQNWLQIKAIEDADAVVQDVFDGIER